MKDWTLADIEAHKERISILEERKLAAFNARVSKTLDAAEARLKMVTTSKTITNRKELEAAILVAEKQGKKDLKTISKTETANRITANILRIINSTPGCAAFRLNNTGIWDESKQLFRKAHTQKGLPDIIACCLGRFVAIEVKAGKDKMSEHQEMRKFEIDRAKGSFLIARSTDDFCRQWPAVFGVENVGI